MSFQNEHAARIKETQPDAIFARKTIAPGIDIILQKPKFISESSMQVQAYRFKKDQFTAEQAKSWLKTHNIRYTLFEPANTPDKEAILAHLTRELAQSIIR